MIIFTYLLSNRGRIVTRDDLMTDLWNNNEFINEIIPSNPVPQAIQEYTQDNLDTEIARLEAEIAAKQELITRIGLLTAETEALDSELAALGIDPNKGTAYTITPKPQSSQTQNNE